MNGAPAYKVDKPPGVKEQINDIAAMAKKAGKVNWHGVYPPATMTDAGSPLGVTKIKAGRCD